MSEPTGHTIDGAPWEEPRGPHLPDRLITVPWPAWAFALIALIQVVVLSGEWPSMQSPDTGAIASWIVGRIATVAPTLIGAALFWRHPDAVRSMPLLVWAAVLLAVDGVFILVGGPLTPILMDVLPPSGEAEFVSWGMIGWQMIGAVVSVASLACLGWGLDRARRRGGAIPRAHVVVAAALTLVATVAYTLALTGVSAGLAGQVNAVVAIVASCASLFALGYVFVVALMGIRSRESPGVGWAAAAAGAAALVGASLLVMLVSYIDDTTGTVPLSAISIAGAAGWIALLAAFALGVPGGSAMPDPPAGTQPGSAGS